MQTTIFVLLFVTSRNLEVFCAKNFWLNLIKMLKLIENVYLNELYVHQEQHELTNIRKRVLIFVLITIISLLGVKLRFFSYL